MRKPTKNSIDYYILPNKILCTTYGLWPSMEEYSTRRKVFACFHLMFSLTALCILLVSELVILKNKWTDLETLAGAVSIIVAVIQLYFKTFYLIVRREKTYTVYKELRSFWDSTDDPVERQSYEVYAHMARTATILFSASSVMTVIMFIISAGFDYIKEDYTDNSTRSIRHLPYDSWHGLGYIKSPVFEILFVGHIAASVIGVSAFCGMDCTCMTTILHLSGQCRLISTWFNDIGSKIDSQVDCMHDCPRNLATDLVKCIRHHQRVINVVNELDNLLAPIIFIQLLTSGGLICLSGFVVISNSASGDLFKFISFLSSVMIQLLMWCWPGEILIQESQEIGDSIYLNIPWYKLPPIYRRQLLLIILRSQEYCRIAAIPFKALCINTLTAVLNAASSYFALLLQMQERRMSV